MQVHYFSQQGLVTIGFMMILFPEVVVLQGNEKGIRPYSYHLY